MDNSYSHLAKHMSQGDVLQDMTAGKPAFPVKPLDKAVVAHIDTSRRWHGPEIWCPHRFMVIPKGQPHKVHCLEPGVVFVSYEGNPDITPIAEHDA